MLVFFSFNISDLSTGFFIVNDSIPSWLRWIKYLAYPHACYSILTINEFTDNRFNCPYARLNGSWDSNMCAPWDGNLILKNQLDIDSHYFQGNFRNFVCISIFSRIILSEALKFTIFSIFDRPNHSNGLLLYRIPLCGLARADDQCCQPN